MTFIWGRNLVLFAVRRARVKINPLADYRNPLSDNCYSTIADCSDCEWGGGVGGGRHTRCGQNAVPLHTATWIKYTITMAGFDSPPGNSEIFLLQIHTDCRSHACQLPTANSFIPLFLKQWSRIAGGPQIAAGVTLKVFKKNYFRTREILFLFLRD